MLQAHGGKRVFLRGTDLSPLDLQSELQTQYSLVWSVPQLAALWGKAASVKLHFKAYKAVWTCKGE